MSPEPPTYIKVLVAELRRSFFTFCAVFVAFVCVNHTPAETGWTLCEYSTHNSLTIIL